ncbi:glycosyltransferase involved in cell wall biosynthesis [Curtobacterium sp. AG1037]|uniref:glycosyltransferase n=1 Tax=Curtobacterium sp. AG1037 TaxID=2183990 RepID=UPI000E0BB0A0|nr:glycosyltransferase [Curtobacterium sp. AG1037]RDH98527.1 glycosyltransferase involved in cell wall biosynthesis [Curtobacterium sp. AG1037]
MCEKKASSDGTPIRIIHFVAHVSPDGRYGGPLRVATDLARAQREAGHHVRIIATYEDFDTPPARIGGTRFHGFPAHRLVGRGYGALFSIALLRSLWRLSRDVDVVHVHLARDTLTSFGAVLLRIRNRRYVLQTHGMIEAKRGIATHTFDTLILRSTLRGASTIFALTESEAQLFGSLGASPQRIIIQPNGVHLSPPINTARDRVLFLARLHPRKGGLRFTEAALQLAPEFPDISFVVAGPDEGDGTTIRLAIERAGSPSNVRMIGGVAPEEVGRQMAGSKLYVLPAEREPFGLTILEALTQGTPVLLHESSSLAPEVSKAKAGFVYTGTAVDLARQMRELLQNPTRLEDARQQAYSLAQDYDVIKVAAGITRHYYQTGQAR